LKQRARKAKPSGADSEQWNFRLYVSDSTPKSIIALRNLEDLCERFLPARYQIEVIDLMKNPKRGGDDQILAVPTVVRKLPPPIRRVIGTLADVERVLIGLDLGPGADEPSSSIGSEGNKNA
jgi:circadian clock protein KaiB